MKVSIIVPVYNVKEYLQKCLDSITQQTLRDKEIIIVDDGSTDGSGEFVDDYSHQYSEQIKVIHKPNGGLMSAWTTGVTASHGDYIGFVDSDDYILPNMFERLYSIANEYNVDIVISNYLVNAKEKGSHPLEEKKYEGVELLETIQNHVFPSPTTYSISMQRMPKLFRRNIIIDNLKYTESQSRTFEDRYIVPAAILSASSIYYTDEAYYCWMIRKGSNHGMYKEHLLDDIKRVYNVQKQVVADKCPSLQQQWEEEYLDFIRLYVDRNIIRVKQFGTKYKSAKNLLNDELTQERLAQYGHLMGAKLGKIVRLSYKMHSPLILALASYLTVAKG